MADAEALVNPVNTAGVMGKGLALQFKRAWPNNFAEYRAACIRGEIRVGRMFVTRTGRRRPSHIINFNQGPLAIAVPTRVHRVGPRRPRPRSCERRAQLGRDSTNRLWPWGPPLAECATADRARIRTAARCRSTALQPARTL